MKAFIYGVVLALLALGTTSLLILYYLQPFEADFNFKESINYADIEFQKTIDYQGVEVLSYAKANLGTLELNNDGYFDKVYSSPLVLGCIDVKKDADSKALLSQNQFQVTYQEAGGQLYTNQKIEVPVGSTKKFSLIGQYNSYNIPFSLFSRDNVKSISLYVLENKEENPINVGYPYNSYGYQDCNTLKTKEKPKATILIE